MLHTHWHAVDDVMYDACAGAPVHAWHTRLAAGAHAETWNEPDVHVVHATHAADDVCCSAVEYVPTVQVTGASEPATQYAPVGHTTCGPDADVQ